MTLELPPLRAEQEERWKLVPKYARHRAGIPAHLPRPTKGIRAPSSGQGPHPHLNSAGSAGETRGK